MADEGSPTPRRALGPLPDDSDDAPVGGGRFARGYSPDEPSPLTSTARLRRLAFSPTSPASPESPSEDPLDVPATTPVPPPAPVLPEPEVALRPASGRRFSASAEPSEFSYVPRRSAVSATSPTSPFDGLPPLPRPSAAPAVTVRGGVPAPGTTAADAALSAPAGSEKAAPPSAPTGPATGADALSTKSPTPPAVPAAQPWDTGSGGGLPRSVATAPTAPPGSGVSAATSAAAETTAEIPAEQPKKKGLFGRSRKSVAAAAAVAAAAEATSASATAAEATPAQATTPTPAPAAVPALAPRSAPSASEEVTPPAGDEPSTKKRVATKDRPATARKDRSAKPAVIIIASVAVVALLVAAGVWLLTLRSGAASGGPTNPTTASALDPLVTAADLGNLGGFTWAESTGTTDAVRVTCVPDTGAGLPNAVRTASRKLSATDSPVAGLVQTVGIYADVETATTAYNLRLTQLGTCKDGSAWISGANSVTGLADAADAVRLVVHATPDVFHTVLLSRTGRSVSLVDVTTAYAAVPANDLAQAIAMVLSRQCGTDLGTCPGSITSAPVPPPTGEPAGWLTEGDLPRITAGAGRWGAIDPATVVQTSGSQCEAMDLETVPGTSSAGQRTLLLGDDTTAPNGFGVDMITYTFDKADAATALADKLTKNVSKCPSRAPTASVAEGPAVKGTGQNDARIAGSTFTVTQKTETSTNVFRVAVLTEETRVVYLLANSTTSFDFTDAQWKAIALRAGQRASQA